MRNREVSAKGRPTVAALVLVQIMLWISGCIALHDYDRVIVCEVGGEQQRVRLPASTLGRRIEDGCALEICRIMQGQAFLGIQGSPVYSLSGERVGFVDRCYGVGDTQVVGVAGLDALEAVWAAASACGITPAERVASSEHPVQLGSSVAMADARGDLPDAAAFGTVMDRRGDLIMCRFEQEFAPRWVYPEPGRTSLFLFRAPGLGLGVTHHMRRVAGLEQVIGEVVYQGRAGSIARLGVEPPGVLVSLHLGSGPTASESSWKTVLGPSIRARLDRQLQLALYRRDWGRTGRAMVRTEVDNAGVGVERMIVAEGEEQLHMKVASVVASDIAGLLSEGGAAKAVVVVEAMR